MTVRLPQDFVVGSVAAKRICADDLDGLCEMHADPAVMATLGGVRDRVETDRYLERNMAHWQRYGFGIYGLRDRETRQFAGRAGLRWASIDGTHEIEVAYALRSEVWARGLATAVCKKLVAMSDAARLATELVAFTQPSNHRSRRVMEKAGFVYERDFEHEGTPCVLYRRTLSIVAHRTG
jgi:ribosomal-protein-alanine N-acetyltransferase